MALPNLTKKWQFNKDYTSALDTGDIYNNAGAVILALKQMFKTLGWAVKGSSDGTTAAMDGADRITGTGALVAQKSWIVLRHTGMQMEVLFQYDPLGFSQFDRWTFYTSWTNSGGFTGGSIASGDRPTATDERQESTNSSQVLGTKPQVTTYNYYLVGMRAVDDSAHRIIVFSSADGNPIISWFFDRPLNAPASATPHFWPQTVYAMLGADIGGGGQGEFLNVLNEGATGFISPSRWQTRHFDGASYVSWEVKPCCVGVIVDASTFKEVEHSTFAPDTTLGTQPDPLTGEYILNPMCWWGSAAVAGTPLGQAVDLWRGPTNFSSDSVGGSPSSIPGGCYYPSGTSRKFIQAGILVMPWDGSVAPWASLGSHDAYDLLPKGSSFIGGAVNLKKFNPGLDEVS